MLNKTKLNTNSLHRGFTIVELLVVIVIIGILATIVLTTYSNAQNKARAAAISDGLKKIDIALKEYAVSKEITQWWDDESLKDAQGESTFEHMIATTDFKDFMSQVPKVNGLEDSFWTYDNDGNVYNGCNADSNGVNIQMTINNLDVAQRVDVIMDDGNLACGKVRIDQQKELVYSISPDATVR